MIHTKAECIKEMERYFGITQFTPVPINPSFFCSREYDTWWKNDYSKEMFDVATFTQHLTYVFASVQEKTKKGTSTHIKEIQAFQKYFETAYRPDDLSRTIREAAVTLREKFMKKLPDLKLPSYVKPKHRYELDFNLYKPKFPRLLSVDFGVAFVPPLPNWFVCGGFCEKSSTRHSKACKTGGFN